MSDDTKLFDYWNVNLPVPDSFVERLVLALAAGGRVHKDEIPDVAQEIAEACCKKWGCDLGGTEACLRCGKRPERKTFSPKKKSGQGKK